MRCFKSPFILLGLVLIAFGARSDTTTAPAMAQDSRSSWDRSPVVVRTSEAVKPGKVLSLYGEGMTASEATVSMQTASGSTRSLTVEQADSASGQFVRALVPSDVSPGVYSVSVSNSYGASNTVNVNAPDPRWLGDSGGYPGSEVTLYGRNLDASEFGGTQSTEVRLTPSAGGSSTTATVGSTSPYAVKFTTPNVSAGNYTVEVRNSSGGSWVKLPDATLGVAAAKANPDPLGLGVSWAQDFAWDRAYQASSYGATPGDSTNDTTAIQQAINAAAGAGGGVVNLAAGDYRFTSLEMRAGVVLQGQSSTSTRLLYTGSGGKPMVYDGGDASIGKMGIAHIGFALAPGASITSSWIPIQLEPPEGWGSRSDETQTGSRYFLAHNRVDLPLDDPEVRMAVSIDAASKILFLGNSFVAREGGINNGGVSELTLKNNTFKYSTGSAAVIAANNMVVEGNTIDFQHTPAVSDVEGVLEHGFEFPLDYRPVEHVSVADNTIKNLGSVHNGGEPVNFETPFYSNFMRGQVQDSDAQTTTISPACTSRSSGTGVSSWMAPQGGDNRWQILITKGRGLGQLREITAHTDLSGGAVRITLNKPWNVVPDSSSTFSVLHTANDVVVSDNETTDNRGGVYSYFNGYDMVMADNTITRTYGLWQIGGSASCSARASYFHRFARNTISGVPPRYNNNTFTGGVGWQDSDQPGTTWLYANEYRDNTVDRLGLEDNTSAEVASPAGIVAAFQQGSPTRGILATVIEGNTVKNSSSGIYLNKGTDSTLLRDNTFDDVRTPIDDLGSTNTLQ